MKAPLLVVTKDLCELKTQKTDADGNVELDNDSNNFSDESDNGSNKAGEDTTDKAKDTAEDGTNKTTMGHSLSKSLLIK